MDTLKDLRRRRGWSQKDLAEESGVGQDTISGIESGRHEPRPSTLRKLADALGVEVADFFMEPAIPKAPAREAGQPKNESTARAQPRSGPSATGQLIYHGHFEDLPHEQQVEIAKGVVDGRVRVEGEVTVKASTA